jgi:hypothetical protein
VFGLRSGDPLQLNIQLIGGATTLINDTQTPPDAAQFDPSQVVFQHYHYTFVASTTQTTLRFTDIGTGNASADIVVDTVAIGIPPLDYSTWQALFFTDSQQNDLGIAGWNADPDLDGVPNALDYYFNVNPLGGITPTQMVAAPHVTAQQPLTNVVTYRRRIGAGGALEVSSDLQTWTDISNFVVQSTATPTGDGVTEDVTVTWTGDAKKFFRVTLSPPNHSDTASQWPISVGGNDHWYELIQLPALTWAQARDYAVNRGGYLATITSAAEDTFLNGLVPMGVQPYFGGYKENDVFRWVTTEPFSFTNWAPDQPDNMAGGEDRLEMVNGDGTWDDTNHFDSRAFVVEYPQ